MKAKCILFLLLPGSLPFFSTLTPFSFSRFFSFPHLQLLFSFLLCSFNYPVPPFVPLCYPSLSLFILVILFLSFPLSQLPFLSFPLFQLSISSLSTFFSYRIPPFPFSHLHFSLFFRISAKKLIQLLVTLVLNIVLFFVFFFSFLQDVTVLILPLLSLVYPLLILSFCYDFTSRLSALSMLTFFSLFLPSRLSRFFFFCHVC